MTCLFLSMCSDSIPSSVRSAEWNEQNPPEKFYLHLKECEYRFNLRKSNVYAELLKLLRKYPL